LAWPRTNNKAAAQDQTKTSFPQGNALCIRRTPYNTHPAPYTREIKHTNKKTRTHQDHKPGFACGVLGERSVAPAHPWLFDSDCNEDEICQYRCTMHSPPPSCVCVCVYVREREREREKERERERERQIDRLQSRRDLAMHCTQSLPLRPLVRRPCCHINQTQCAK
jgi:hypothetical protein